MSYPQTPFTGHPVAINVILMNDNPIDQTKVNSAKALARLRELSAKQEELAKQQKELVEQEQEITKNRIELLKSEEIVEVAERALNEHYSKVKSQQYRWEKRLTEINELTEALVHSLDMVMPSSMIPRMKKWEELREFKGRDHHRFTQLIIEATDYADQNDAAARDWQDSVNGALSFTEMRELVRDRDRLITLNAQKTDILHKMEKYPEKQAITEHDLRVDLEEKLKRRNECADRLSELMSKREDSVVEVQGVVASAMSFAAKAKAEVIKGKPEDHGLKKVAEGTITIPPNSTVELPLGDLLTKAMEENNSGIASAKKLTLSNDKLRLKTEKNAELTRQAMVRVGALRREADYSPEQLIEWGKTREQGNTMPKGSPAQIYTMQFIEKADVIGNTIEVICDQVQKGKWVDNHAQMQIAFRAGFRCPQRTGVKVLRHIKDTVYMVHFLQYDVVTDIALQVPSEPKIRGQINTHYNKYKILSCLPWHPNWTPVFERSGKIVPADVCSNSKYGVNDAIRFHRQLMDALPALPSIVPDIAMDMIGMPKDPTSATAIALGD